MTELQKHVMNNLVKCLPGKGMVLPTNLRRSANSLIKKGYVYSINGGFGDVYILTDEGREAWYRMI